MCYNKDMENKGHLSARMRRKGRPKPHPYAFWSEVARILWQKWLYENRRDLVE